ncbi:MAG: cupin domain-containing protein [Gammaproteobacteria bacterium]
MYIRSESKCESFVANDGCDLIELIHPKNFGKAQTLGFSLAIAEVAVGAETYHHRLDQNEVYYLLSGHGEVHVDAENAAVSSGDAVLIPAGSVQWIRNIGDTTLKFAAIVSPPWTPEGDHLIA